MKALVLEEYNKLIYKDVPKPAPNKSDVLVKVKACGICGSDVHGMDGGSGRRIPPIIMGHEASGVIVETGNKVKNYKSGDRITFDSTVYNQDDWYTQRGLYNLSDNRQVLGVSCDEYRRDGAFAEYVVVPQHILHHIPHNVSFEQAAMAEPAAVALHAINLSELSIDDCIVVMGAGIIGLFVIQILNSKGYSNLFCIDIDKDRLLMAAKMGAKYCLRPEEDSEALIKSLTDQRGCDIVFDAVGIDQTFKQSLNLLRKGGQIILIGNIQPMMELPLQAIVTRQIRLQGSCAVAGEYPDVLNMLSSRIISVDDLISQVAPLSDGAKWFQKLYNKEENLLKVILKP